MAGHFLRRIVELFSAQNAEHDGMDYESIEDYVFWRLFIYDHFED